MTNVEYQLSEALAAFWDKCVKISTHYIDQDGLHYCDVIAAQRGYWHVASTRGAEVTYTERPVCVDFIPRQVDLVGIKPDASWTVTSEKERCARNPWAPGPPAHPRVDDRAVYFIQGVDGGPIKIGCSSDPKMRLAQLQSYSPVELRLIGIIPDVGMAFEQALHKRFGLYRSHGEWFHPSKELTTYIEKTADALWEASS